MPSHGESSPLFVGCAECGQVPRAPQRPGFQAVVLRLLPECSRSYCEPKVGLQLMVFVEVKPNFVALCPGKEALKSGEA